MSTFHHGHPAGRDNEQSEVMKRLLDQFEQRARREYPRGRVGSDDEGTLAFAIAADPEHGVVRLEFGKAVSWLGMEPKDAVKLAEMLIAKAREVSAEPLTISV